MYICVRVRVCIYVYVPFETIPERVGNRTSIHGCVVARLASALQLGLYTIVSTNILWCTAYKRGVGGGVVYCPIVVQYILPNSRAIVLHQGGQCRWAQHMKGWLIRSKQSRSEGTSCKGQPVVVGD